MEKPPALNTVEGQCFTILISLIRAFEAGSLELGTTSAQTGGVTVLPSSTACCLGALSLSPLIAECRWQ